MLGRYEIRSERWKSVQSSAVERNPRPAGCHASDWPHSGYKRQCRRPHRCVKTLITINGRISNSGSNLRALTYRVYPFSNAATLNFYDPFPFLTLNHRNTKWSIKWLPNLVTPCSVNTFWLIVWIIAHTRTHTHTHTHREREREREREIDR